MLRPKKIILSLVIVFIIYSFYLINFNYQNFPLLIDPNQITPVSPVYYVKLTREFFQSNFVFGDEDLSYWYFTIANKRITEAQILKGHNLNTLARNQLELAKYEQAKGFSRLKVLIDVIDTNNLQRLYEENQERIDKTN